MSIFRTGKRTVNNFNTSQNVARSEAVLYTKQFSCRELHAEAISFVHKHIEGRKS